MNKEWVKKEQKREKENILNMLDKIIEILTNIDTSMIKKVQKKSSRYKGKDVGKTISEIVEKTNQLKNNITLIESESTEYYFMFFDLALSIQLTRDPDGELSEILKQVKKAEDLSNDVKTMMWSINNMDRFLDSEPIEFDGDIVITDPCYFVKKPIYPDEKYPVWTDYVTHKQETDYPDFNGESSPTMEEELKKYDLIHSEYKSKIINDWETCDCGYDLEAIGFSTNMCRDTLIGDWSCAVIDSNKDKLLGRFSADSGMVCVVMLDDIVKYNPSLEKIHENTNIWTVIKNFKGKIQFVVTEERGLYEENSEFHNAGDEYVDYSVVVSGHGINTKTGENIDFISKQTGF